MKSFRQYLEEKIINIGFGGSEDKELRQKHGDEIHHIIQKSYSKLEDGYGGKGRGTEAESKAIHSDIHDPNHAIKVYRRGGKITHATIYKKTQFGRKVVAAGTDGTEQGKKDYIHSNTEDIKRPDRHSYGEVSGAPENIKRKLGARVIPNKEVEKILGKPVEKHEGGEYYSRSIGGQMHKKVMVGNPKV